MKAGTRLGVVLELADGLLHGRAYTPWEGYSFVGEARLHLRLARRIAATWARNMNGPLHL